MHGWVYAVSYCYVVCVSRPTLRSKLYSRGYGGMMNYVPLAPQTKFSKVVFCRVGTNHTRVCIDPGYYPTKNFCKFCRTFIPVPGTYWKFCTTFIPVPGTSGSSARESHKYPGYRYIVFITLVSSVRPCHNTRNFCEFCNTSVPDLEFV